jgi:hypothetical protein
VWGFGMLFFFLIFGEPPIFDAEKKPLFPQFSGDISARVKNLILQCLVVDAHYRTSWV